MRTFSLIFILLCSGTMLGAQDLALTGPDTLTGPVGECYVIAITHPTKPKVIKIAVGKKMTIWSEGTKVRGKVTSITADSVYIDSLAYAPKTIDKLRVILPDKAMGGTLLILGGIATTSGGAVMIAGSIAFIIESQEAFLAFFAALIGTFGVLIGAAIVAGGVALITTGIIIIARGKTFDMHKKWNLTIVPQTMPPP